MKRPSKGDRWQNRRTSRVCVVEEIKGGPDVATTMIAHRYEDGAKRMQWTSLGCFNVAFTEFEAANNADATSESDGEERR